jgi:hypothetical protein
MPKHLSPIVNMDTDFAAAVLFGVELNANKEAFAQNVSAMSIEGLTIEGKDVKVGPSTELFKCGVRRISGFMKHGGTCVEIALIDSSNKRLSTEEAEAVGLEDEVHTIDACDLKIFLVKLLAQTL